MPGNSTPDTRLAAAVVALWASGICAALAWHVSLWFLVPTLILGMAGFQGMDDLKGPGR